jgi:methionyl-tRNA synthetase
MRYITTSIVYANADPHVGFALELLQADFLARYYRLQGEEVYFLTGIDEHGLKIQTAAAKSSLNTQAFVDRQAGVLKSLISSLHIEPDRIIRTTDQDHQAIAQALWKKALAKGDIYKKRYRAWYNIKEEEFVALDDEVNDPKELGIDPKFLVLIDEENYFFRLSKYKNDIQAILEKKECLLVPENRRQEILNFIQAKGVQDISISREKSKLEWGINVPEDDTQVMYVWFDALTNYLSAVSKLENGEITVNPFWPPSIQIIGKDIQRFHAVIWLGMLLAADLDLPKEIMVHGFLTLNGVTMSKSLGLVVNPLDVIQRFGLPALRWYLLEAIPTLGDGDFNFERLEQVYLSDLANDFGNLVSRVWVMVNKYFDGLVPNPPESWDMELQEGIDLVDNTWTAYHEFIRGNNIAEGLKLAHGLMVFCNRLIDSWKPWILGKSAQVEDKQRLAQLIYYLLETIRQISLMVKPALPDIIQNVQIKMFTNTPNNLWQTHAKGQVWGGLNGGLKLGEQMVILFPKDLVKQLPSSN